MRELEGFKAVYIATGKDGETFDLLDGWDAELFTTSRSLVFMAGEVCGQTMMEGIAAGRKVSMLMEGAMQTGRVIANAPVKQCEKYDLVPKGAVSAARIRALSLRCGKPYGRRGTDIGRIIVRCRASLTLCLQNIG